MRLGSFALAAAASLMVSSASAATYTFTADEFNGDGSDGPTLITTWNVILGVGESIVSAVFNSTFGNSFVQTSADGTVTVGGVTVATCANTEVCWNGPGPTPIDYSFAPAEFANLTGSVDLIYDQLDCCVIRLGQSTLTIETDLAPIPLPAAGLLLLPALGGLAAVARRRSAI